MADTKMSMNGKPTSDSVAAAKSGVANIIAIRIAKPKTELMIVENHIANGRTLTDS